MLCVIYAKNFPFGFLMVICDANGDQFNLILTQTNIRPLVNYLVIKYVIFDESYKKKDHFKFIISPGATETKHSYVISIS